MSRNNKYYQEKLPSAPEKVYKMIDFVFGTAKLDTSHDTEQCTEPSPGPSMETVLTKTQRSSRIRVRIAYI